MNRLGDTPYPDNLPGNYGDTSKQAAEKVKETLASRQEVVLRVLNSYPRTVDDVSALLNVPPNAVSGRFTELKSMGYIEPTGEVGNTRAGSSAKIMRITHKGRLALVFKVEKPQGRLF